MGAELYWLLPASVTIYFLGCSCAAWWLSVCLTSPLCLSWGQLGLFSSQEPTNDTICEIYTHDICNMNMHTHWDHAQGALGWGGVDPKWNGMLQHTRETPSPSLFYCCTCLMKKNTWICTTLCIRGDASLNSNPRPLPCLAQSGSVERDSLQNWIIHNASEECSEFPPSPTYLHTKLNMPHTCMHNAI